PAPYPEDAERCRLFGHRETPVAGLHKRAILTDRMAGAAFPLDASWLNAVQGFLAKLTRRRLKRGVFRSVVDLQFAINRFVAETNADPKPFVWTADPKRVLAAVKRGKQTLESVHQRQRGSAPVRLFARPRSARR